MRGSARLTVLLWLALLAGAGLVIHHSLRISGDLRLFMPTPRDAVGRLLLQEVSEGPASKLLLLSIQGAPSSSNGVSVPRPTEMLLVSMRPMPV